MCAGMSRCVGMGVTWSMVGMNECVMTMTEDIQWTLILFFHDVGSRNQPQVFRLTFTHMQTHADTTQKQENRMKRAITDK